MNGLVLSRVMALVGAAMLIYGIFGQFGVWWGLISAGTLALVASLTMIDVDEPTKEDRK